MCMKPWVRSAYVQTIITCTRRLSWEDARHTWIYLPLKCLKLNHRIINHEEFLELLYHHPRQLLWHSRIPPWVLLSPCTHKCVPISCCDIGKVRVVLVGVMKICGARRVTEVHLSHGQVCGSAPVVWALPWYRHGHETPNLFTELSGDACVYKIFRYPEYILGQVERLWALTASKTVKRRARCLTYLSFLMAIYSTPHRELSQKGTQQLSCFKNT